MKPQLQIHIPKPCHEDWNKMAPVDKGKFCGSCNKQVVDFSLMSDQQVLNYFSTATGKTCGRFAEDQLQRELIPTKIEKKKTWWFAALMPLLLFFDKATAQKKNITTLGTPAIIKKDPIQQIMGKVAAPVLRDTVNIQGEVGTINSPADTVMEEYKVGLDLIGLDPSKPAFIIKGKITDSNGLPLAFASVATDNDTKETATDSAGTFTLEFNDGLAKNIFLKISYVGYEPKEIQVHPEGINNEEVKAIFNLNGNLIARELRLEPIVCAPAIMGLSEVIIAGGVSVCSKVKRAEVITNSVRKVFLNEAFTAYPNPALKGSALHIDIKRAGEYSIQLLDNNSKLISVDEFTAARNHAVTSVEIPSTLASGIYYIRVIDERNKKSYVDKIVVQ